MSASSADLRSIDDGRHRAGTWRSNLAVLLFAIVAAGLVLRILAARGDLWIDEVWTLALLSGLDSAFDVFWKLSHANNHYLNSIWMFLVGPDGPEMVYRLPAIIFGALSVATAVRIGLRSGPVGGIVSGAVFAISYPMVNFGSEARGYSGLILAVLLAVDAFERALPCVVGPPSAGNRDRIRRESQSLGLAIGFGALCHLTMLLAAGILVVTAWVMLIRDGGRPRLRAVLAWLLRLFGPAAILTLPALAATVAGLVHDQGMTLGENSHAPGRLVLGYGGMLGAALGFPSACPPGWALLAVAAIVCAAGLSGLLSPVRTVIAAVGLVVVPGAVFLADVPNTEYPRYFIVCGVLLTIVLSGAAARALERPTARFIAVACLAMVAAGHLALDARLIAHGRGEASRAVALLGRIPQASYAANFKSAHEYPLDYYGFRDGVTITRLREPFDCAAMPMFYIAESAPDAPTAAPSLTLGPQACQTVFANRLDLPTSPLSGSHWTLYQRP